MDEAPLSILEPENPLADAQFSDLDSLLQQDLTTLGWSELMLVQKKTIPYMDAGRDMVIQSKTGSGKTGAFLIPLVQILDETHDHPQALILVPTRELAIQVEEEFQKLTASRNLRSVSLYGGVKYEKQLKALKEGVHLVVATPGRLMDHIKNGNVDFKSLRDFVMDEADEMLSMGFYDDMKELQRYFPKEYCTTLFSATMPETIKSLSREFQSAERGFLSLSFGNISVSSLKHTYCVCDVMDKDATLLRFLEYENPASCIIFCNMKRDVNYLGDFLKGRGYDPGLLSGDIPQKQRQATLTAFREEKLKILIATDVAARGIDISHVTNVYLHDHPDDSEVYVHRAGRTARAGRDGTALSIVSSVEELALKRTANIFEIDFEKVNIPTDDELVEKQLAEFATILSKSRSEIKPKEEKDIVYFSKMVKQMTENGQEDLLAFLLLEFQKKLKV